MLERICIVYKLDESILNLKVVAMGSILQFHSNFKSTFCKPIQTHCSVTSDLALHCLLMSHGMGSRLLW